MTPKAFKACFVILFKLYEDLKADYEFTIGTKECHLIFFNALSADHHNKFVQQQKEYHNMTMDEVVSFFQVCHATDQPLHEQHQCEAAAKKECKEANHPSNTSNDRSEKRGHTENPCCYCKLEGVFLEFMFLSQFLTPQLLSALRLVDQLFLGQALL